MEIGEFHQANGWHFKRLAYGVVQIRVENDLASITHTIPPNEWISIVAHLADAGSAKTRNDAEALHARASIREMVAEYEKLLVPEDRPDAVRFASLGENAKPALTDLEHELRRVLNMHSAENASNTPDFILATYLTACLDAFNAGVKARSIWYYGDVETPGRSRAALPEETRDER